MGKHMYLFGVGWRRDTVPGSPSPNQRKEQTVRAQWLTTVIVWEVMIRLPWPLYVLWRDMVVRPYAWVLHKTDEQRGP